MLYSDQLYQQREDYYNLQNNISIIISSLSDSLNLLNPASDDLLNGFKLNDNSADNGNLCNCRDRVTEIRNNLQNILNGVSGVIDSLSNQYNQALEDEERERQERRRREEEQREKEEEEKRRREEKNE